MLCRRRWACAAAAAKRARLAREAELAGIASANASLGRRGGALLSLLRKRVGPGDEGFSSSGSGARGGRIGGSVDLARPDDLELLRQVRVGCV
jgi:hypothetical protein